jgi:hypothetical protein
LGYRVNCWHHNRPSPCMVPRLISCVAGQGGARCWDSGQTTLILTLPYADRLKSQAGRVRGTRGLRDGGSSVHRLCPRGCHRRATCQEPLHGWVAYVHYETACRPHCRYDGGRRGHQGGPGRQPAHRVGPAAPGCHQHREAVWSFELCGKRSPSSFSQKSLNYG